MKSDRPKVIIIKKVKKGHGGHHGGSWKVAYADFVTAMMAFFMVMWILGMDQNVRQAIEGYFSNPVGMKEGYSTGASPISSGNSPGAISTKPIKMINRMHEVEDFKEIARRIQAQLEGPNGLGKLAAQVEVIITQNGLRIELIEAGDGETFFAFGSAELKPAAQRVLRVIASELREPSTSVVVEGHTDSAPFGSRRGYSNWELSSDRAHAARRAIEGAGVGYGRIRQIRGYADHELRNPENPLDPANRRISILLPFSTPAPDVPGTISLPGPGAT